jgi:flagellar M-ring protein FliF
MALVNPDNISGQFVGMSNLPIVRQLGLLIGLAASIALGVGIYFWAKEPNYVPLFDGMSGADAAQVVTILEQGNTPYRMQGSIVAVPAGKVHNLRIQLASQGLPKSSSPGFELLDEEQSFGTSSFVEKTRFNRALEGELARSIATLNSVKGARVHLAIPKKSAFLRNQQGASASVLISLFPGRKLNQAQVAGVIHLVASSVSGMDSAQVTVVDQQGNLLTGNGNPSVISMGSEQFTFASSVEENYSQRIVDLLVPIMGAGNVRAQVTADVDFTATERTSETFGPNNTLLRSEQTSEERSSDNSKAIGGTPGAQANQPAAAETVPGADTAALSNTSAATQITKQATRNYELDKVVSHIKEAPGTIKKLSVAVLLDYRLQANEAGELERLPLPDEEIERLTQLVKEAVGFNEARGDSVNLMNASFLEPEMMEPLPEIPVWQEPWVLDIAKQSVGALGILLLVFGILRPVMKNLAGNGKQGGRAVSGELQLGANQAGSGGVAQLPGGVSSYDQQVQLAQNIAGQSPKRAASVMSDWVQDG